METVLSTLLSHSLPHDETTSECWMALAADDHLCESVLDHLTDIVTYAAPYEQRSDTIASFRLLSAISALKSMCQVEQLSNTLQVIVRNLNLAGLSYWTLLSCI